MPSTTPSALEMHVERTSKYILETRCGRNLAITEVIVYHVSGYRNTVRTKSFIVTPSVLYSIKISFDKSTNTFRRVEVNLEIPRGRADFRTEIVMNSSQKSFIMSFLGDMKLPGILVEKGDNFPPEELAARLVSLVTTGTEGWANEIAQETGFTDEELSLATKYLAIERFELLFRNCVVAALEEKYGENADDRINEILENELERITSRVKAEAQRYGQDPPVLDLAGLLQYLGFEHYVKLFENSGMWSKCLERIFKDQHQAVEGLKSIRDARNEISHFRATVHPNLWATASMYIEILEGRVRMMDPAFLRLIRMVERKPVGPRR